MAACTEELDVDYAGESNNKLVVEGRITTDTMAHTIKLTRTVDFNAEDIQPERNAIVTIFDGDKIIELTENEPGIYQTAPDVYGEVGKTYTLNIELDNEQKYEAVSQLNPVSTIDSIRFVKESFSFTDDLYIVYFYGQEPPEKGNFYYWNLYLNDSLVNDTIDETRFESDAFVNGQYIYDFDIYWVDEETVPWDTVEVTLEMLSIPEDYNSFLIEVFSETSWRGGPFDPTPANVLTNVSNGGIGFFYAAAINRETITYYKSEAEKVE